jgi:phage baseplate assembly protein gpV
LRHVGAPDQDLREIQKDRQWLLVRTLVFGQDGRFEAPAIDEQGELVISYNQTLAYQAGKHW